eukprot:1149653-Pelagomonas_calceolata.AAC.4
MAELGPSDGCFRTSRAYSATAELKRLQKQPQELSPCVLHPEPGASLLALHVVEMEQPIAQRFVALSEVHANRYRTGQSSFCADAVALMPLHVAHCSCAGTAFQQTSLEYAEVGRVVDVALAAVKYGAPGADAKGYLAKVQGRLAVLEKVPGWRGKHRRSQIRRLGKHQWIGLLELEGHPFDFPPFTCAGNEGAARSNAKVGARQSANQMGWRG